MFSGEKLKNIREEKGYSQAEVAKLLNISRVSYFNWENGKTKPNQKNLNLLSRLLGVEETYFVSEYDIVDTYFKLNKDNRHKLENYADDLLKEQEKIVQLPKYYVYKVFEKLSAGTGYSYFGDGNYDTVFYDEQLDHDFASWVFGDSMEPTYLNGEVVLIKQTGFDYDGAIYAVDWDGQTYIKKVYREEDGLRLVSLNKHYADKFAPYDENPRIIGKIVGNFMPLEV
ncbi:Peptidase S24-like [Streptococcus gallolyticus]|uniref:Peptidase S24-like n=1 Tax=Streptococcus gallolyticus TaxID=315405 RepID=A0A1H7U8W3_9STRE|nr:XRE family transcriptional regulator [Streptococcus gallolyticus]SDJ70569.1 Phage repressor protein C, contains Cro/C1-type HTH and peptisase s24 domains [Streptococcus gallolyticus]SDL20721.1 Phage repressor protein C, contains Cro/C1-type HTH and peptisase s24 domains [Streptococcus gallolyticus]SEF19588.1 Predicted transcriptional regulator [Streptococcus gallolyticus]SEL93421.1 Peptidase S24-like [Streptococcus gallolyticus]